MKSRSLSWLLGTALLASCSARVKTAPAPQSAPPAPAPAPKCGEPGLGGRLFDNWFVELGVAFMPDNPSTPEADGKGGPFGNGTLPDGQGKPVLNSGHDYRLKNLFGWDLRGGDGIYGERFANKSHVLVPNFLKNTEGRETWVTRLEQGEDAIPAYGQVLSHAQIEAVVDFLLAVRDGSLPQPDDLYSLRPGSDGYYELNLGADTQRGHAYYAETCAKCHGNDGTAFLIDGEHTLGTLMRSEAYVTWLKILNGVPGTEMCPQLPAQASRDEQTELLRDLHAAMCDRTRYPKGNAVVADVPDGDPRCGAYLK